MSELNSAYPEKPLISPDPSEKRTKQKMDIKAPEKVPALASSREGNKKQVTSSKKEEQSETKTVIPPRAKRQKRKDKTQLINNAAILQQQQPSPLMVLVPAAPHINDKLTEGNKKINDNGWKKTRMMPAKSQSVMLPTMTMAQNMTMISFVQRAMTPHGTTVAPQRTTTMM